MLKPLISTRLGRSDDAGDLTDIDVKSFEISWTSEHWYELVRGSYKNDSPRTITVATYYGNTVGFAVAKVHETEAIIEKLAVKEQFRRHGAATNLLHDVIMRAEDKRLKTVALIMPESFIYPVDGMLSPAVCWATAAGLKPTRPFIKDYFTAYGEKEDGIKFVVSLNHATPTN